MSLINDALTRAKQAQPAEPPPLPLRPVEPVKSARNGMAWILRAALGAFVLVATGAVILFLQFAVRTSEQPRAIAEAPMPVHARTVPAQSPPASPASTDPAVSAVTEPAAPDPLPKVQAIIFHPRQPSATVGGKTVFIGESVGEFRVTAITATSVTVARGAETHTLSLQ